MKLLFILSLLTVLTALPVAPAQAQESQDKAEQNTVLPGSAPVPSLTQVLGQPVQAPAEAAPPAAPATATPTAAEMPPSMNKIQDIQILFQDSLRQMMPLDDNQIQEYRERSDQRERALLPVSPQLNSRTVHVSLEPGSAPVKVFATANIATSLLIHDSTGQPWPITSVTNGGPAFFQVLRPELPDGNLLNIMPTQNYGATTIVITLEKQDIPLIVRLESDSVRAPERRADALVLFQIAGHGPKASIPAIEDIKETTDSSMLAFLDLVPPEGALRVSTEPELDRTQVWNLGEKRYIRTSHSLVWPAWAAVVNGAGSIKCYEAPLTSKIMLSVDGTVRSLVMGEANGSGVKP